MKHARAALATLGLGMAVALIPASPAWACSCIAPDPATQITIEITDSAVADAANPFGGRDDFTDTVDLRGAALSVLGDVPTLLDGADIESVPVLATVFDDPDPNMADSCGTQPRPESGSDIELSGVVLDEGAGAFIYAGPCSGTFMVTAGPGAGFGGPPGASANPGRSLVVPIAIGAGGLFVLALFGGGVLWPARRDP